MSAMAPGGLGGTYSGNPVACAAATGVFEVLETENILSQASQLGQRYVDHVEKLRPLPGGHVIGRWTRRSRFSGVFYRPLPMCNKGGGIRQDGDGYLAHHPNRTKMKGSLL